MPTNAENMVTKLEERMLKMAGLAEAVIDGRTVKMADVLAQHRYWKKQVALEAGTTPKLATIDLSGGAV